MASDGRVLRLAVIFAGSFGLSSVIANWVVTLLEDRPIVLLDEWAADQDPAARRRFYELLLPQLRSLQDQLQLVAQTPTADRNAAPPPESTE